MSYQSVRTSETIGSFDGRIEDFVRSFNPRAKTIVLVPGGMGSQLDRSGRRYNGTAASQSLEPYAPLWMSLGLIFGDAPQLLIGDDGHDAGDRVIVADGPVRFFLQQLTPYDATEHYFRRQGYNFVVFGYDWRRPVDESALFFRRFLEKLRKRTRAVHGVDPAPQLTILTHSMGGLVAKLFLNLLDADPKLANAGPWFRQFVSVAAPFFGTSTHVRRFYIGQEPLTTLYGKRRTAQISGALPGPYILIFLDAGTYATYGAALGLTQYPMWDETTLAPTDPYDPANLDRFPSWVRRRYLEDARDVQVEVARPLSAALADRVFHIRSGRDSNTPVAHAGARLADPDNGDLPIRDVPGPGDGTVPFWSARLPQTPDARVYNCERAADHGELMEHGEVLQTIFRIIDDDAVPAPEQATDVILVPAKASRGELDAFIADVKSGEITADHPAAFREDIWRRLVLDLNP